MSEKLDKIDIDNMTQEDLEFACSIIREEFQKNLDVKTLF